MGRMFDCIKYTQLVTITKYVNRCERDLEGKQLKIKDRFRNSFRHEHTFSQYTKLIEKLILAAIYTVYKEVNSVNNVKAY